MNSKKKEDKPMFTHEELWQTNPFARKFMITLLILLGILGGTALGILFDRFVYALVMG